MQSQVQEKFSDFFQKWLIQQEIHLQQLLSVPRDSSHERDHKALVAKVMKHYKEYYTMKWARAHEDVLVFFSPPWLSPLENSHLWITGWKPSFIFRLFDSLRQTRPSSSPSLASLAEKQVKKIEELRVRIAMEEEKVEREMERQQMLIADQRMVELARLSTRVRNGEVDGLVDVAMRTVIDELERIMKIADCVRLKALKGVFEVLTPVQSVEFMAAELMVQIRLRIWGKRRGNRNLGMWVVS
ncbi:hypothetical protein GIB67_030587 [Kingdonia uniflora]|uniref:DOG1 domain-containing protein n=1 Tax=Kingdonia uniflora TaxID=39325 RepID=A0A7J7PCP1_9MAGN|nr:hypothetical protein GIB67_030587 [Kingdonia uniflora]